MFFFLFVFLKKLNFSTILLQFSVSYDPSEIGIVTINREPVWWKSIQICDDSKSVEMLNKSRFN